MKYSRSGIDWDRLIDHTLRRCYPPRNISFVYSLTWCDALIQLLSVTWGWFKHRLRIIWLLRQLSIRFADWFPWDIYLNLFGRWVLSRVIPTLCLLWPELVSQIVSLLGINHLNVNGFVCFLRVEKYSGGRALILCAVWLPFLKKRLRVAHNQDVRSTAFLWRPWAPRLLLNLSLLMHF